MIGNTSVTTTLSLVLRDEADPTLNDDDEKIDLVRGPAIKAVMTVGYGQIYLEFPDIAKEIIYGPDKADHATEKLSLTIDYFNNRIQILHNATALDKGQVFDDNESILIIPSVTKFTEKNQS